MFSTRAVTATFILDIVSVLPAAEPRVATCARHGSATILKSEPYHARHMFREQSTILSQTMTQVMLRNDSGHTAKMGSDTRPVRRHARREGEVYQQESLEPKCIWVQSRICTERNTYRQKLYIYIYIYIYIKEMDLHMPVVV